METKPSTLEMALMGLLLQGPRSGYDLRKTFATTAWRHYSDSPGSIYPALKRLEKRGWIAASNGERDARKRQEFRSTSAGKKRFAEWLAQPLTPEDVRYGQQELVMRFAFMDGNVPREVPVRFLEDFIAELKTYLPDLKEFGTKMRTDAGKTGGASVHTGLLAFESGIAGMEAQLAWAQKARSRLIYANRT